MKKNDVNLELIKLITELNDGEYEVNTSQGNFKVEKSNSHMYSYGDNEVNKKISIIDEKGNPFSRYYFEHRWDHKWYDNTTEYEIDYPNQINLDYDHSLDLERGLVDIYLNDKHTKFYRIREGCIYDETQNIIARVENATISNHLVEINLNNYDRIVLINNEKVKIPQGKDIEEELNKYNQAVQKLKEKIAKDKYLKPIINQDLCTFRLYKDGIKLSDFKKKEEELLKLYKIYLDVIKIINYRHDINIMREIISGLNPEFHKLFRHSCRSKYDQISPTLDEELLKLKCGVYFIPLTKGLMQIDILPDDYCLKNAADGNPITEIEKSVLLELIVQVKEIVKKQQEEDREQEKKFKREQIKQLTRELNMLEKNQ